MRYENNELRNAPRLAPFALAFGMPVMLGCPYLFDPACFSHLGEDPRNFPDFEAKLSELLAEAKATNCGCEMDRDYSLHVGTCGNSGVQFIWKGDGFTGTVYYYRADGDFLALSEFRDFPTLPCGAARDWPRSVSCESFETTETICERHGCPSE